MREMKDSGVEWIGQIPKDWITKRFKYIHRGANVGESIDKDYWSFDKKDVLFYTAGATPINTSYKRFPEWKYTRKTDILLARNGTPYVYLPVTNSAYSDHIIRTKINDCYDKRFIAYSLQQSINSVVVDTVSIATWSISLWDRQYIPVASIGEQKKIADFLDEKCSEIDSLTSDIQKQIDTLEQYKKSVITETVTKGLNPDAEMKDSGVDWIGDIPSDWETIKIGRLFSIRNERNTKPMDEVQLLSLYTGIGVFPHGEQEERGNKAVTVEGYKIVHKNDIVVNIILAWMGAIGISEYDGVTSPAYDIYVPDTRRVIPHFYHYVFRTKGIAGECYKYGRGIMLMRWRTYAQEFKQISVPFPSIETQQEIADYLDKNCSEIDTIISDKKKQLEVIAEYKKSLIYEYVTGKKEVM